MKLKRIFDIFLGLFILLLITPFVIVFCFMIFIYDGSNPLYISTRIGLPPLKDLYIKPSSPGIFPDSIKCLPDLKIFSN